MGNQIMTVIRQVGVFIICAQAVLHFKPNASYEKYIKLLVSVMVLIQLFIPIANIFFQTDSTEIEAKIAWYQKDMQITAEENILMNETAAKLENMTLEEIKTRLNKQQEEADKAQEEREKEEESNAAAAADSPSETETAKIDEVTIEKIEVFGNE